MSTGKSSVSKGFVWVILALLIIGLAGFGATNLSGNIRSVGAVGDKQIEVQRYVRALQQELRRIEQQIGQPLDIQQAQAFGLDRQVLQELLVARSVDYEASQIGLSIGDENLRNRVVAIPAFQSIDGSFSRENYQYALENAGLTEAVFETNLREEIARSLLQAAILAGTKMPNTYADQLMQYIGERREFTWARVVVTDLDKPLDMPTAKEIENFYTDQIAQYTTPEIKQLTYVALTPEQLVDKVQVSDIAIRQLYQARDAEFNKPERRLLDRLAFADNASAVVAKAEIDAAAVTFDQLVEARGLSLQDVSMGDVSQSELDAAGEAVFNADIDQVVGPFSTDIGPTLFRINGFLNAQATSLDTARGQLRSELALDIARSEIDDQVLEIDDLLAGGATLEELAIETNMELVKLDWYAGNTQDIASYTEFQAAASTVTEEEFPELIALPDGGIFALRLDATIAPSPEPLAKVRDVVIADWRKRETMAQLRFKVKQLTPQLIAGVPFDAVGLVPKREYNRTRRDRIEGTPEAFLRQIFATEPGAVTAIDDAASILLVRVDAVLPWAKNLEGDTEMEAAILAQAANDISQDIFTAYAREVQNRAGFELDQQALNAVHAQLQ